MRRVLIAKLDAIGDYILFRNVLPFVRTSARYRDAHVAVFGNPAWRTLAEAFDASAADEWIWCTDRNGLFRKGYENLLPRALWSRRIERAARPWRQKIREGRYDEIVVFHVHRDRFVESFFEGLSPRVTYAWNLPQGPERFVFLRNRMAAGALVGEPCEVPLELNVRPVSGGNRVVFFTGASHWTRRWPRCRWRELARSLPDGLEATWARRNLPLPEFLRSLAGARAVVSNDTMGAHAAAAMGLPTVLLSNGVSGRDDFWPYPKCIGKRVMTVTGRPPALPMRPFGLIGRQVSQYLSLAWIASQSVRQALVDVLNDEVDLPRDAFDEEGLHA